MIFGCLHSSFIECWLLDPYVAGSMLSERGGDFVVVQNLSFCVVKVVTNIGIKVRGCLSIYNNSVLMEESKYKCLLISDETTVEDVIR